MSPMSTWPLVDPQDDGIRPAGRPDACFYCRQRVGSPHAPSCGIVTKRIEMRVTAKMPDGRVLAGLWQFNDPYDWAPHMSESHKNNGTWCANNFLDDEERKNVTWDAGADPWVELEALSCLCGILSFAFVRVVDPTPRRKLKLSPRVLN